MADGGGEGGAKKRRLETAAEAAEDAAALSQAEYRMKVRVMLANMSKEAMIEMLADL